MKSEGHLQRAEEIYRSIQALTTDNGAHVSAIVDLVFVCAFHYLAYGCDRKFQRHFDTHARLPSLLRTEGESNIAITFELIDTLRHGRVYGGKGNGETIAEALDLLEVVIQWSHT